MKNKQDLNLCENGPYKKAKSFTVKTYTETLLKDITYYQKIIIDLTAYSILKYVFTILSVSSGRKR